MLQIVPIGAALRLACFSLCCSCAVSFGSLTLYDYYSHSLYIDNRYNQYCLVCVVRFLNIVDWLYCVVGSKKGEGKLTVLTFDRSPGFV